MRAGHQYTKTIDDLCDLFQQFLDVCRASTASRVAELGYIINPSIQQRCNHGMSICYLLRRADRGIQGIDM